MSFPVHCFIQLPKIFTGFPLFRTDKIPWYFHDFPRVFSIFSLFFFKVSFPTDSGYQYVNFLSFIWTKKSFQLYSKLVNFPFYFSHLVNSVFFQGSQVFPGFMSFFPWYLLNFSKFHDISRFSRCTLIFPGFPGRVGTLNLTCSNYDKWIETIQKAMNVHFNFRFCIFLRKHLLLIICQANIVVH